MAKEASVMVLTDGNFANVYAAVEEGPTAFRNIRMATFFLLSTGAADILIILTALGLRWPLPLVPAAAACPAAALGCPQRRDGMRSD